MALVRMRRVVRRFGDASGLDNVNLDVRAGEVMGLAGGRGTGKSALIDMLAGELMPDSGQVVVAGNPVLMAASAGVMRVIRDPDAVALDLSVAENVCVGVEPRNRFRLVDRRKLLSRSVDVLSTLGLRIDPRLPVRQLSPAMRCAVQAANAYTTGARVVAFDGLSAFMPAEDVRHLHSVVEKLAEAGVAVIYASRCVQEMQKICDQITVLGDVSVVDDMPFVSDSESDEPVLEVRGLRIGDDVHDVSFGVGSGEIVAVIGAGRSDVGRALFGAAPVLAGEILLHGSPLRLRSPRDAVRAGVGYMSDCGAVSGLVPGQTVAGNLRMLAPSSAWSRRAQQRLVTNVQTLLGVEYPSPRVPVDELSLDEMRKIGLAKWLAAESQVLVIDEPGTSADGEIRWMIRELAAAGVAVVVISSDSTEVTELADRVVVLQDGYLVDEGAA
ncbi:sugar ABC transporter ATP-binding protein [Kibdelosporangium aridum]|uniref:Sugar ABC transporter ATP-binding protein n=1 Tax=Kibdelosporangium aridum TaxID=2030 RepID=A0A428ZKQ4_KIBAR|nr:ATP-binding cassette domain-containing protein [Kibdelosporangium aridum]RSM88672.1 sugar ABC transporter ATP-binding protein [Kibdelosporangium aridum]